MIGPGHIGLPPMRINLRSGYTVVALGYMIGIFILSELPARGGGGRIDPALELLSNLIHTPLFAGLAWCLLMSLCGGQESQTVSWQLYRISWLLGGAYAILEEWHQSFVPGRTASLGDLLLDFLGIAGLLLFHSAKHHRGLPS